MFEDKNQELVDLINLARTVMSDAEIKEIVNDLTNRYGIQEGFNDEFRKIVYEKLPKQKVTAGSLASGLKSWIMGKIGWVALLATVIGFIFVIKAFFTDRQSFSIPIDHKAVDYLLLSISLPYLLSTLMNYIRSNTDDTGKAKTSYYSGPHFFSQAEIFGDLYFKKSNNEKWKKYYITFLIVSFLFPLAMIPFFLRGLPFYIIIAAALLAPLSFLTPHLVNSNFLIPELMIEAIYESKSYELGGSTHTVGMKKLFLSTSEILFNLYYGIILVVLALFNTAFVLFNLNVGWLVLIMVEGSIVNGGGNPFLCLRDLFMKQPCNKFGF